ncbi:hypothetical protein H9Y04_44470 [Streptomyces sp. TRM66268-LWL]|uniref:Transposase n=1 Tax=Streptomyces polyasparticus TaxID=2767826 RepID=A0ABR7SXF0_9ACTN|nr:hypothetical protein [Streptomyces polyasparticus]MBC9719564.1 hypothetical protein [Streptomyces polyasparticus]
MTTVKRYARHSEPDRLVRSPTHRPGLVDPFRAHQRERCTQDPAVPVTQFLAEIRERGCPGSANLLVRYINSGRIEADHAALSPRRVTGRHTTHPDRLDADQRQHRDQLAATCTEMSTLEEQIRSFVQLLAPAQGNAAEQSDWTTRTRAADRPFLHVFTTGLAQRPHPTRQHYGRAEHHLLRQLIPLN